MMSTTIAQNIPSRESRDDDASPQPQASSYRSPTDPSNIIHVEGGAKHLPVPVPSIRVAARFSNPLGNDESDGETTIVEEVVEPPDVIEGANQKQMDAFRLLLQNTYSSTHERHCADLPLPKELLENTDISWILRTHSSSPSKNLSPGRSLDSTLPSLANTRASTESPTRSGGKGRRNLDNLSKHRKDRILIDSPRSVMVLMKAGTNCSALKVASDPITEGRIKKTIEVLRGDYKRLTQELSQHCVVQYLVSGGSKRHGVPTKRPLGHISKEVRAQMKSVSPCRDRGNEDREEEVARETEKLPPHSSEQTASSRRASTPNNQRVNRPGRLSTTALTQPRRSSDLMSNSDSTDLALIVQRKKSVAEHIPAFAVLERRRKQLKTPDAASPQGSSSHSPSIKRAQPRNLQRLLQHRDLLTADWGVRQQKLVNEAYTAGRLDELHLQKQAAKKAPSPTVARRALSVPLKESSPTSQDQSLADVRSQTSLQSGLPAGVKGQRQITEEEKIRRKHHIAAMRENQRDLEERRRIEFDNKLKQKEELAKEAASRRADRRRELTEIHKAKEKRVKEVNDRMQRTEAYKSLQLVQRMEEEAERAKARENIADQERKAIQEEYRQRNILEYETRKFVTDSTVMMDKILCQQQTQARRTTETHLRGTKGNNKVASQRKLKEESRQLLKQVLRNEDKLISHWKVLDELDH